MDASDRGATPIDGSQRFLGLAENLERHAGTPSEAVPPDVTGNDRGYGLVFFQLDEHHLTTVITSGLRYQAIGAQPPQEIACTVYREQAEAAKYLVEITADLVLANTTHLVPDQVIPNEQPLLANTELHGVLASGHPLFAPEFTRFTDAGGAEQLQVFTLLPVTLGEINYALDAGVDALRMQWSRFEVDVFDIGRPSVA